MKKYIHFLLFLTSVDIWSINSQNPYPPFPISDESSDSDNDIPSTSPCRSVDTFQKTPISPAEQVASAAAACVVNQTAISPTTPIFPTGLAASAAAVSIKKPVSPLPAAEKDLSSEFDEESEEEVDE